MNELVNVLHFLFRFCNHYGDSGRQSRQTPGRCLLRSSLQGLLRLRIAVPVGSRCGSLTPGLIRHLFSALGLALR
jgi:hypothetical protein